MKKAHAIAFAGMFSVVAANSQGTVNFANYFGNLATDPAVFFSDGTTGVAGAQYVAALMGGADVGSLALIAGSQTAFLSQGFFIGPSLAIPGVPGGTDGTFQVLAWDTTLNATTTGATFADAMAYANSAGVANIWGESAVFTNPTGMPARSPPGLPADLVNLRSFSLNPLPEPTVLALLGIGSAGLVFFRRRR